jgi:hypothetical protein
MKTRRTRVARRTVVMAVMVVLVVLALASAASAASKRSVGRWVAGDIHTHTWLTDGKNTQGEVIRNAFENYGLDYFANSEHGGQSTYGPAGIGFVTPVWRWITLTSYSYPIILDNRELYPERRIIQGVEWNAPTHEHVSVGIVGGGNEPGGVSAFEYRFDAKDTDLSRAAEGTKEVSHTETDTVTGLPIKIVDVPPTSFDKVNKTADDTISAVKWLDDSFSSDAYAIVNHPSRAQLWHVGDFRAMNDAAPEIAFGMEGLPGHQPDLVGRGGYDYKFSDPAVQARARTYGGADWMTAQVGGLWDSLLGEGRGWWIFNNSDFHTYQTQYKDAAGNYYATQYFDFWPGQYAKTWTYTDKFTMDGLVEGMRSGNVFVANGDLINALDFTVADGKRSAKMGATLSTTAGKTVTVTIAMKSPKMNENGDPVKVDHVDLIAGDVTGPISPSSPDYTTKETNSSTKVITSFKSFVNKAGWLTASFKVKADKDMYFRLRGTNLAPNTANETDAQGNPLIDEDSYLDTPNPDPKAAVKTPTVHGNLPEIVWGDLWFYSNPVFVDVK